MISSASLFVLCFSCLIRVDACAVGVLYDDGIPQLGFAAEKVTAALKARGEDAVEVVLEIQPDASMPEAFAIQRMTDGQIKVTGTDAAGAMYGGLEVAELIRVGGVERVQTDEQRPYMEMRGVKFNIPLDARTPSYSDMGDAGQHAMEDVWDPEFWKAFIDEVAGHRYNYISLWNLHPFPSLVIVPDYPDVALADVKRSTWVKGRSFDLTARGYDRPEIVNNTETLKTMSIDEKIDFWRAVMRYGKERNVDFYFVTWNIFDYGTEGKYGIDDKRTNPITTDYFRKSVKQLFLTYPDLRGIGLTAGENMPGSSQQQKEDWAYKTYGLGVLDVVKEQPGRKITFLHRQHMTGALDIAETFKPLIDHPDIDFIFSFKYAKAHVYSATKQPYHEEFVKDIQNRGDLKTIWTLRNDSVYLYRWAAPGFVREFVKNIPDDVSRGYYYGSDGWVWGRGFLDKHCRESPQLELGKHWFEWLLWGRLAYDPDIGNERFVEILQARFPGADARRLMDAWESASMIYPVTTGFHWGVLDFKWYIEGCISQPGPANTKTGFHDVNRFISMETHPCSGYVSIPDYVKTISQGRPFEGIGPNEVARQLHADADQALDMIHDLDAGNDQELGETLDDIAAMAYLGHYYGHKIKGACELHLYRELGGEEHRKNAVSELTAAAKYWDLYAANSERRYVNPVWCNRVGVLDWSNISEWVGGDIEIARAARPHK